MKPEIKKLWVDALRSGEFPQGLFQLKNVLGGYCCLGVLCEVYRRETGQGTWNDAGFFVHGVNDSSMVTLPDCVQRWAELNSGDPWLTQNQSCSYCNDSLRAPFSEIAARIEAVL